MWLLIADDMSKIKMNRLTRELQTADGRLITHIYEDEKGVLQMSLAMDTNFKCEEFSAAGWDGNENHVIAAVYLKQGGGQLHYKRNRHSQNNGEEITINIMQSQGILVPTPKKIPRGVGIWDKLFS